MEHIGCYLKYIYFQKKKGHLIVHHNNFEKHLFFREGNLISAKTNRPQELIGEVLCKIGKISEEEHSQIERYIQPQKNIGETLIQKGLISSRDLQDGLLYQMREIALNLFSVFEGKFKYMEKENLASGEEQIKMNIPILIEEGVRRMKFHPELKNFLKDEVSSLKDREFFYRLTEEEKELLGTIDGKSTSEKILASSDFDSSFFWKSLYLFYCLNLVGFETKGEEPVEEEKAKTEISEETQKNLNEALELSEKLSDMDHYQILGIPRNSDAEEIKKAYFRLARRFHPDLFARRISRDEKEKVESVFGRISKAYHELVDKEKREEYDRQIGVQSTTGKKDVTEMAEVRFRKGKTLYDQGRFEEAMVILEDAVRLISNKGKYYLLLAMTESKIPSSHKKAEEDFKKAIKLDPWNPEAFVGLGMLYKSEGLPVKAEKNFRRALAIDRNHKVALRELQGEKKDKKGLKGLLSLDITDLKNLLSSDIFSKKKK
ncbi:DnaJ domain-containing protein [bacterium]|nr:DnaJ domain-containing protein [bacterium]